MPLPAKYKEKQWPAKKVYQWDPNTGELVKIWPSVKSLIRAGTNESVVHFILHPNHQRKHRGFLWTH